MNRAIGAVCMVLLAGALCLSQAASTYHIPLAGAESSPGEAVKMSLTTSGMLAGGIQVSFQQDKGSISAGEWTLTTASGTLSGKITRGTVTFDNNGRVASIVDAEISVTGGSRAYAGVKSGSGILSGANDPNAERRSISFQGQLSLTF